MACSLIAIVAGASLGQRHADDVASIRLLARAAVTPQATSHVQAGALETDDPLAPEQWYLARSRIFDAWPELPALAPVKVAVIDSGIDFGHPEFKGRIAAARTFVRGTPQDTKGHGTIIAGLIAANLDNGLGIVGAAPSSSLLVAKVVRADESVSVVAEAKAIRWAVDEGARVISISLSGLRSPHNADEDSFSILEADAIAYAVAHDVLVVASVGNGDQSPSEPWQYAAYPAALPARRRGQRDRVARKRAPVLESRYPLQRPRRTGRRDALDLPAAAESPWVQEPWLHALRVLAARTP